MIIERKTISWMILLILLAPNIAWQLHAHGLKLQATISFLLLLFTHKIISKTAAAKFSTIALCFSILYLSVFWSYTPEHTVKELAKITPFFIILLFCFLVIKTENDILTLTNIIIFTGTSTVIISIYLLITYGSLRDHYRGTGELKGIAGPIGIFVQTSLTLILYKIITVEKLIYKSLFSILLLISIAIVIATVTRSAISAMLISFTISTYFIVKFYKKKIGKYLFFSISIISLFSLLLVTFSGYFLTENLSNEIDTRITLFEESDLTSNALSGGRLNIYNSAMAFLKESPIIGIGYEAFSELGPTNPHNIILDFWLASGLIGLGGLVIIIFLTVYGYATKYKKTKKNNPYLALLFGFYLCNFIGLLFYGMFWQLLWNPLFYILIAIGSLPLQILNTTQRNIFNNQHTSRV